MHLRGLRAFLRCICRALVCLTRHDQFLFRTQSSVFQGLSFAGGETNFGICHLPFAPGESAPQVACSASQDLTSSQCAACANFEVDTFILSLSELRTPTSEMQNATCGVELPAFESIDKHSLSSSTTNHGTSACCSCCCKSKCDLVH